MFLSQGAARNASAKVSSLACGDSGRPTAGGGLCVSLLAHLDGEYLKVAIAVALRAVVATLLDESEPRCSAEIFGHRLVDASRIGGPHCGLDNAVLIVAQ